MSVSCQFSSVQRQVFCQIRGSLVGNLTANIETMLIRKRYIHSSRLHPVFLKKQRLSTSLVFIAVAVCLLQIFIKDVLN